MKRDLLDTNMMGHFLDHRRGVSERIKLVREQGAIIIYGSMKVGQALISSLTVQPRQA